MKLILEATRSEARDVTSFTFRSESPVEWQAGQFLHVSLPHPGADERGVTRYFTIASAPFEGRVMFTTRFATGRSSTFKDALRRLPPGATVDAGEPDGDFVIGDPGGPRVFIAGGIGITPFRAILLDLDHRGLPIDATLLYANRTPDVVYKAEIDQLATRHRDLAVRYLVSPERITPTSLRAVVTDITRPTFHVSGPEGFVEAMYGMLSALGVPDAHVKLDYFPGYDWPPVAERNTA